MRNSSASLASWTPCLPSVISVFRWLQISSLVSSSSVDCFSPSLELASPSGKFWQCENVFQEGKFRNLSEEKLCEPCLKVSSWKLNIIFGM
jgi:hypothetical protein